MNNNPRHPTETGPRRPLLSTRLILASAGILLFMVILFIWVGNRNGVAIAARYPAPSARDVPGTVAITVQFSQPMQTETLPTLTVAPDIAGANPVTATVRWQGDDTVVLRPLAPLLPETDYVVELADGQPSASGDSVSQRQSWRFTTRGVRVLFLTWDDEDRPQLATAFADGSSSTMLTNAAHGVADYAAAPDGGTIAYATVEEGGAGNLWLLTLDEEENAARLLLDCGGDQCRGPVWTPDGRRLVYERRQFPEPEEAPGPPRLWWLDPASGATTPLFDDDRQLGHTARFSGNGRWLSYIVPLERAMHIYDFESGEVVRLGNEVGEPASWHPWRDQLLTTNIEYQGESFSVHIFRVDLPAAEVTNLSLGATTNDAAPVWSPTGEVLVFGRKVPRAPVGRQIWVMQADGQRPTPLTADLNSNFGLPAWSPDGEQLLVQRFNIDDPTSDPGIWLIDVADGSLQQVAASGFQPTWLP